MKIIILAGGGGTRLWPLSRTSRPKQFAKLINDKTLIENTLARFTQHQEFGVGSRSDFNPDDIYISASPLCASLVKEVLPNFNEDHLIIEPEKRDTGPAMGFVAAKLSLNFPNEPIAFIPSDAYIQNPSKLIICLKVAERLIKETGKMLDIGIPPEFPSVHLGYTKIAEKYDTIEKVEIYNFAGHTEKPNLETAKEYLNEGNYLWHGNFYMWTPRLFLEAYKKYAPETYSHLEKIVQALKVNDNQRVSQEFSQMEKISIDYVITEKMDTSQVLIIKADFGWSDIGAFDVLYDKLKEQSDVNGNVVKANHTGIDTKNCLIYDESWCGSWGGHSWPHQHQTSYSGATDPPAGSLQREASEAGNGRTNAGASKKITTIGISDLVIVDTPDALLICPKNKSQDVKKIVEKLKEEGEGWYT